MHSAENVDYFMFESVFAVSGVSPTYFMGLSIIQTFRLYKIRETFVSHLETVVLSLVYDYLQPMVLFTVFHV